MILLQLQGRLPGEDDWRPIEESPPWVFDDGGSGFDWWGPINSIAEAIVEWVASSDTANAPGEDDLVYDRDGRIVGWLDGEGNIIRVEDVNPNQ